MSRVPRRGEPPAGGASGRRPLPGLLGWIEWRLAQRLPDIPVWGAGPWPPSHGR